MNIAKVVVLFQWFLDHSTVYLCRDIGLDDYLDLLPLVWIWFHFAARVLRCRPVDPLLHGFGRLFQCPANPILF
jgi:hypothetical protein